MSRNYLLVHNDIRTGPFTLEELLLQSLHADSLVWIIGQSEDWLPPLEIADLQSYFTKQDDGSLAVNETVLADIRAKRFKDPNELSASAGQRSGVLDSRLLEQSFNEDSERAASVQTERSFIPAAAIQKENKTAEEYYTTREPKHKDIKEPPVSLEEDSLTIAKKNWAVVGIAVLLILFISWNALFNDDTGPKRKVSYSTLPPASGTIQSQTIHSSVPEVKTADEENTETPAIEEAPVVVPSNTANQTNDIPAASTDAFLDSVQRVLDSQDQLMANVDEVYKKSFYYRKRYNTNAVSRRTTARSASFKAAAPKTAKAQQAVTDPKVPIHQQVNLQSRYILDNNKKQVNSVELIVRNNSKEILKTVSVDVFYYKKGERLLNKETVYFSNIYPNQSLTKSVAGNQHASSARFQLGTVSTGKN